MTDAIIPPFDKNALAKAALVAMQENTLMSGLTPLHIAIDPASPKGDQPAAIIFQKSDDGQMKVLDVKNASFSFGDDASFSKTAPISKGIKEISGTFEAAWEDPNLKGKYLAALEEFKTDPWAHKYMGEFAYYQQSRLQPVIACAPPLNLNIWVPQFTSRELATIMDAKQAVFERLLVVTRKQRCAGYIVEMDGDGFKRSAAYRTACGSRCPFGYMIPDSRYHIGLERLPASNPAVMEALGLSFYLHNEDFCRFLGEAQCVLHDQIPYRDRVDFMARFERNAIDFAHKHDLAYFREGDPSQPMYAQ